MGELKHILLTTDFSETSEKAIEPALTLAKAFGARVTLAYVEEDRLPPLVIEYTAVSIDDLQEHHRQRARERLTEFAKEKVGTEVPVELQVADGVPHIEIVRLARELDVDLIVMATHGRGFISHAFLGSTTERVLRRAHCPVFVARDTDAS